jgi:hypothetical protein
MIKETKNAGEQAMAVDPWFVDFTKRATPRLKDLMQGDEGQLPSMLSDMLERLRQSERDDPKR